MDKTDNNRHEAECADLDSLLVQLGAEIYERSGDLGIKPPSPKKLKSIAERWLRDNEAAIRKRLQNDPHIRELAYGKKPRERRLIATSVIESLAGGFPYATLAIVIAHHYLDHYLEPQEKLGSDKNPGEGE